MEEVIHNWKKHIPENRRWDFFYEVRLICLSTRFFSQKDAKVFFEVDTKDLKNTLNMYSTALFHKLFFS